MRTPHTHRFLLMLALLIPATSLAEEAATCPAAGVDQLRQLTNAAIDGHCKRAHEARNVADGYPSSFHVLKLCRNSMRMARENALVVHAAQERRQGSFQPETVESLTQAESYDRAARILLGFHNYTNISMAATYRARLKLRKFAGRTERAEGDVAGDVRSVERALSQMRGNFRDERKERHLALLKGLHADLRQARACLDSLKQPLDEAFQAWANVKTGLLRTHFSGFVNRAAPLHERRIQGIDAVTLQRDQQYVHDVLTDPSKRDWAYRLAEGCQEYSCDKWSVGFAVADWGAKATGAVARTPVFGTITKIIAGGLSGDLAKRQGLTFWQQVREFLNAVTPFGLDLFDTEVKAIERGEVRPFVLPAN